MRAPSVQRLEAAFPGKGAELRAILKAEVKLSHYKSVQRLINACFFRPDYRLRLMTALNEVIEGYGVESITKNGRLVADYVNMGDSYALTLLLTAKGTMLLTSWGDFVESNRL